MLTKMLSRKFFVLVLFVILAWAGFFVALKTQPEMSVSVVIGTIISAQVLLSMAYIGGNVWQKFLEAKFGLPPKHTRVEEAKLAFSSKSPKV